METDRPAQQLATPPFRRLLVANRGEIAVRVIRACRELGVEAVAVYGPGEERAVHVRAADDAYRLSTEAPLPYLDIAAVVDVARRAGAEAVHPGYGFLAENAGFAAACAEADLVFVGPSPTAIRAMGDKVEARRLAAEAGVPVVPGSEGPVGSAEAALAWAEENGYPVAVKAAGGGGGRGFRVARDAAALPAAFVAAAGEAERSFANPVVYLERYLERPRHVEVQLFADAHGAAVAVGDRDCSLQRRHQKLVEEAPAPNVPHDVRGRMGEAAVALARAVGYVGAGTVEFLLLPDGAFFFLEMNTRIQVEHPVTELVTGIDLVAEQVRVAAGAPLSFGPNDVAPRGHAIECRINAEDPGRGFAPAPGTIGAYREPAGIGVRVDGATEPGSVVLPAYDSLLAKLVAWGRDRDEAIARMRRALAEFVVEGVPTTIPFHRRVMEHPAFRAADLSTDFLPDHPDLIPPPTDPPASSATDAPLSVREIVAEVNDRRFVVRFHDAGPPASASVDGAAPSPPRRLAASPPRRSPSGRAAAVAADGHDLRSPIQGTVLRVAVAPGQVVEWGAVVCVVEAMKMENELVAHRAGAVAVVKVQPGDAVKAGDVVATIE